MTTASWVSPTGGSWNPGADWNPTGGPRSVASLFGPYSMDTALFATGSTRSYLVTGNGNAQTVDVSGDHVTFQDFTFRNSAVGAGIVIEDGARVTVAATSNFVLVNHDGLAAVR